MSTSEPEKAGKKPAVRRKKRDLRSVMTELLALPISDPELWNTVAALGVDPAAIDNNSAIAAALFRKALSGDVSAFKEIHALLEKDSARAEPKKKPSEAAARNGVLAEILEAVGNEGNADQTASSDREGGDVF